MYSTEFLVGTNTIRFTTYLTNQPSSFSVRVYGKVLVIALTLSFTSLIFLSTTATASPAPVVSKIIPLEETLLSNHSVDIAPSPSTRIILILKPYFVIWLMLLSRLPQRVQLSRLESLFTITYSNGLTTAIRNGSPFTNIKSRYIV